MATAAGAAARRPAPPAGQGEGGEGEEERRRRAFGRRARCWDVGARAGLAVAALVPGLLLAFLAYQLVKQAYT
ncbi:MAG: hypothetical protein ACRDY0_05715, partial [Acidimicrobiales bacterium]